MSHRGWQSAGRAGILTAAFALAAALSARAGCPPEWLPGEGFFDVDSAVCAMTTWDPDGLGGQPELLVVGGVFTMAGDVIANNIAAWDGTTWQPLGSGMDGAVWALTVYPGAPGQAGELIAGGAFTTAGGNPANFIARWNGATWQALGNNGMNDFLHALMVYDGELIAGGWFTAAGGNGASYIARWNGATWQPVGSGMGGGYRPYVYALTVYPPQAGELVAGGYFTTAGGNPASNIARWNGATWQPLGSGIGGGYNPHVDALTVYPPQAGELIAGGSFTTAGGNPATSIARWNGATWQPLGSGTNIWVDAITVYPPQAGELIAGGAFTTAGGNPAYRIARWDGATWQPLGSGVNDSVYALTVYPGAPGQAGELIAGGNFTTAGGQVSASWARWGCPYRHGDLNCDGTVDFGDINPFVLALANPTQYDVDFPDCDFLLADMNCDGTAWFEDINPFVACLSYGDCGCP